MAMLVEYFDLQEKFTKKYGDRALVLIQCGSFYEMYEYDPNNCATLEQRTSNLRPEKVYDQKIGNAVEACKILEIFLTSRKGGAPYSINNPNMAGFPIASYEKNKKLLLNRNFVVIRIDQVDSSDNIEMDDENLIRSGGVLRKIAEIASSATQLSLNLPQTNPTNNIVSIYIEYQTGCKSLEDFVVTCGLSSLDVMTGENMVCELYSKQGDNIYAMQEIYHFLLVQQPREIIINVDGLPSEKVGIDGRYGPYAKFLRERLELDRYQNLIINCNQTNPTYLKLDYQKQFFQKIFFQKQSNPQPGPTLVLLGETAKPLIRTTTSLATVFLQLGIEMMIYGRVSLLLLLQYCHEHGEKNVQNIKFPKTNWLDSDRNLILTYNATQQLDISSTKNTKNIRCLMDVVDMTSTKMGFRVLYDRIHNPLIRSNELNDSYDLIDEMIKGVGLNESNKSVPLILAIEQDLRGLPDLGRYQRKLFIGDITPKELVILYLSYVKVTQLYLRIYNCGGINLKKLLFSSDVAANFNQFIQRVNGLFKIEKLGSCTILKLDNKIEIMDFPENPLQLGVSPELDQLHQSLSTYQQSLDQICDHLNQVAPPMKGSKISYYQPTKKGKKTKTYKINQACILVTVAKAKKLEQSLSKINRTICGDIKFIPVNSKKMIHSETIERLTSGLENFKLQLRSKLLKIYRDFIAEAIRDYHFYQPLIELVGMIDFIKSAAKAAKKYKYFRPTILDSESDESFLRVKDIRHPVIERIIDQPYVTNDLSLGGEEVNGILMYGANSTGKSSLAKALGLIILMAQAGLYTAGQLTYKPYKQIITRLSGNDDLLKGQSSFVVEMEELRIILRNANSRTLVLGDELCRGTESQSATGLTVATLEELVKRKSSFIFSTHLHHLAEMDEIKELGNRLKIYHLNIRFDSILEDLVIERKIKEGSGSTSYGIEIAKSLGLKLSLIQRASEIRRKISGENDQILSTQTSHYNRKVYKTGCLLCGAQIGIDTHHLLEQHTADSNGLIEHVPKDLAGNLVGLCKKCHQYVHREGITLESREMINGSAVILNTNN
jgi:DNA mismatch repair protein MutS